MAPKINASPEQKIIDLLGYRGENMGFETLNINMGNAN
jgi:hypothetical protein